MTQILELITKASQTMGSDYKLAQEMDVPRQNLSAWKSGKKPCPPEDQARLAGIAGFDPVQALIRAHLERHEGTAKGDKLFSLLGKRLLQTGAASVSLIAALAPITWVAAHDYLIRCIERLTLIRSRIYRF